MINIRIFLHGLLKIFLHFTEKLHTRAVFFRCYRITFKFYNLIDFSEILTGKSLDNSFIPLFFGEVTALYSFDSFLFVFQQNFNERFFSTEFVFFPIMTTAHS